MYEGSPDEQHNVTMEKDVEGASESTYDSYEAKNEEFQGVKWDLNREIGAKESRDCVLVVGEHAYQLEH